MATIPAIEGQRAAARVLPSDVAARGSKSGELKPAQQFESFVLQGLVETMLPAADSGFFGEGTAGTIWRSMLAERIGAEIAASGGVGIAEMVENRNASVEALGRAKDTLEKNGVAAQGAALSKPGAL
jgi:peptidoglycan hydrolase FlgJ